MNLSILKAYNLCEILLFRSIQLLFFPSLNNPIESRKYTNAINTEIKKNLPKPDSTNNRHIIEFLKLKVQKFDTFSDQKIRIDLTTNWASFFEMFSILRHIITHQGSIVDINTHNQIKSKAKDIFERHFDLFENNLGFKILNPLEGDLFSDFINLINDFSLNTVKFIFNETDLSFLDMN
jgi:hypothetical protein